MKITKLSNGLSVWALNDLEVAVLDHEVFGTQSYLKHGIRVCPGDCVFDVGANIGIFTLFLAQKWPTLRIFAFEPVPQVFKALRRNIHKHAPDSAIELLNVGLSREGGSELFEFDAGMSPNTTMRPQNVSASIDMKAGPYRWVRAGVRDLERIGGLSEPASKLIQTALKVPVVRGMTAGVLLLPFVASTVKRRLFLKKVVCRVTTVSEIIREHHVQAIDLLKIDVEGSEADVIDGIDPADWPKIRQVVVEVHDSGRRVEKLRRVFEKRGFQTVVDQSEWEIHKLLGIFTIYATARSVT